MDLGKIYIIVDFLKLSMFKDKNVLKPQNSLIVPPSTVNVRQFSHFGNEVGVDVKRVEIPIGF